MNDTMENLTSKLTACQAACNHCYDACLKEEDIDMMRECIRTDHDCADMCGIVLSFAHRDSALFTDLVELCAKACDACAEECENMNIINTAKNVRKLAVNVLKLVVHILLKIRIRVYLEKQRDSFSLFYFF